MYKFSKLSKITLSTLTALTLSLSSLNPFNPIGKVEAAGITKTVKLGSASYLQGGNQESITFGGKPSKVTLQFRPTGGQEQYLTETYVDEFKLYTKDSYNTYVTGISQHKQSLPLTYSDTGFQVTKRDFNSVEGEIKWHSGYSWIVDESVGIGYADPLNTHYIHSTLNYDPYYGMHGQREFYFGYRTGYSGIKDVFGLEYTKEDDSNFSRTGMVNYFDLLIAGRTYFTAEKRDLENLKIYVNGSLVKEVYGTVPKNSTLSLSETIDASKFTGTNDVISFTTANSYTQVEVQLTAEVNNPPTLDIKNNQNIVLGEDSLFKLNALTADSDGDPITYKIISPNGTETKTNQNGSLITNTCNTSCDIGDGNILYFPKSRFPSGTNFDITLEVSDGKLKTTKTFPITIKDTP